MPGLQPWPFDHYLSVCHWETSVHLHHRSGVRLPRFWALSLRPACSTTCFTNACKEQCFSDKGIHTLFATNKHIHCIWRCCWIYIIDNTFQNLKNALQGIENKWRLQTLSVNNAWSNKHFLYYLTFRMLQHTSSEVNGYNCYKHFKKYKNKEGNWWQDKKQWQNWYYR